MIKKLILAIVAIAVVFIAVNFLKQQQKDVKSLDGPKQYTKKVDITHAKEQTVDISREFLAQVLSSNSAYIASKFSANIKKIYVNENDTVKKGDLLVSLDDSEIQANLASLRDQQNAILSDVQNTKTILDRNKKLYKIHAISKEALDNTKVMYKNKLSSLNTMKQKIKQTKSSLQYLNIKAPFDGRVGLKMADDGSLAMPGKPILTINSDDQKLVFSFVDTNQPILQGQKVYMDDKLIGEISKRYDDAKNSLLVAQVKLYKSLPIANKSFITIKVVTNSAKGCMVPTNSILHKTDAAFIVVYKDGKFQFKKENIIIENAKEAIIDSCTKLPIAVASEAKLALLPSFGEVLIDGDKK